MKSGAERRVECEKLQQKLSDFKQGLALALTALHNPNHACRADMLRVKTHCESNIKELTVKVANLKDKSIY